MLLMASEGLGIAKYVHDTGAGGIWPFLARQTQHVEWQGCALWDLIQPSFTFIVGVAMPFSLAGRAARGQSFGVAALSRDRAVAHPDLPRHLPPLDRQAADLFHLRGHAHPDRPRLHVRCSCSPGPAALAGGRGGRDPRRLLARVRPLPAPAGGLRLRRRSASAAPGAAHGLHGFAAHWDKNTNFAAGVRRLVPQPLPRAKPFAYNGGGYLTLSFIPTLGTMLLGLLAGGLMRSRERPAGKRIAVLAIAGLVGLGVGVLLDVTGVCPSSSASGRRRWVLFSGGWCCLLLAAFYAVIDVAGWRRLGVPAGRRRHELDRHVLPRRRRLPRLRPVQLPHPPRPAVLPARRRHLRPDRRMVAPTLLVLWLVLFWMYRRKIFLRI